MLGDAAARERSNAIGPPTANRFGKGDQGDGRAAKPIRETMTMDSVTDHPRVGDSLPDEVIAERLEHWENLLTQTVDWHPVRNIEGGIAYHVERHLTDDELALELGIIEEDLRGVRWPSDRWR